MLSITQEKIIIFFIISSKKKKEIIKADNKIISEYNLYCFFCFLHIIGFSATSAGAYKAIISVQKINENQNK